VWLNNIKAKKPCKKKLVLPLLNAEYSLPLSCMQVDKVNFIADTCEKISTGSEQSSPTTTTDRLGFYAHHFLQRLSANHACANATVTKEIPKELSHSDKT
jgi:hypothetical protein